jgi:subtilisin family serine protease
VASADSESCLRQEPRLDSDPLGLVGLTRLISRSEGQSSVAIGLVDGPVAADHPNLRTTNIRVISGNSNGYCADLTSVACMHGTFVAGILSGIRGCGAPAICPECTLLVRPIFAETASQSEQVPSATPTELAQAILDVIEAGARVINLSVALVEQSTHGEAKLGRALDYSARKEIIVVGAAGNQGTVGSSIITRHPWVIPVVAYNLQGHLMALSNLGGSIGRRGVGAAGEGVTSLRAAGGSLTLDGTSVATPFVTGTVALLWSCFPEASAADIKLAVSPPLLRRRTIVPPLLDAESAYQTLAGQRGSILL